MSKEQAKAYLESTKLVETLAKSANEAGYEVSEADLEEVLGGIFFAGRAAGSNDELVGAQIFRDAAEGSNGGGANLIYDAADNGAKKVQDGNENMLCPL